MHDDRGFTLHYIRKDLLYRVYPRYTGPTQCQLIVPEKQRKKVMLISHESTMGGHQGISKTVEKILTQFFGPDLHEDVALFCRSCDICQRTIHKGNAGTVPLQQMPLIDQPFKSVAVDLVRPIHPVSDSDKRYMLKLVDYATCYPEAVALSKIDKKL